MAVDEVEEVDNSQNIAECLPSEICLRIFSMLGVLHLIIASQVSKAWRAIAMLDEFWCKLACKDMPVDFPGCSLSLSPQYAENWRKAYERRFIINRRWTSSDFKTLRFAGHRSAVFCVTLMNDELLATAGDGIEIRIWNLKKKKCEHTITSERSGYLGMHFMPETQRLLTGSFNGSLRVWDMNISKWQRLETASVRDLKEAMLANHVDFSDCIEKSELIEKARATKSLVPTRCRMTLEGHAGAILALDSYLDRIASGGNDGTIRFWNATTGKIVSSMPGHEGSTNSVKFFDSGRHMASVGHDGIVAIHDVEERKKVMALGGHIGWIWGMHLDPTVPHTLASSSIDRTIRIWDLNSRKCVEVIHDHPAEVPSVHVDWERHRMISTSFSGKALVHDTRTWKPLIVFEGFQDRCTRLAYTPDATFIGSVDGTVRSFNFAYGL
jgi:WD40 repeat protein